MKKCIFSEILLLSKIERKARKVSFDPKITIIIGKNDTGKSSVIKNLFWAFGTEPLTDHRWRNAKVIAFVKFKVDGEKYSILRRESLFAIFDKNDNLISSFNNVTAGLGPFLANLFDFKVVLNDRQNNSIIPPPAFYFLPFYVDQDQSWTKNWAAFNNLGQIPKFKSDLIDYHLGVRPNEYYVTKGEVNKLNEEVNNLNTEERVLRNILKKLNEEITQLEFNVDIEQFKKEINDLINECQALQKIEDKLKNKLIELNNSKIRIEQQINIAYKAQKEAKLDYKYALSLDDDVDCPTCGAIYQNNIAERFEISLDEGRAGELLIELNNELIDIEDKIIKENKKYLNTLNEIQSITEILEKRQGDVQLNDIISSKGKNELKNIFNQNISRTTQELIDKQKQIKDLANKLKTLVNNDKKNAIQSSYIINIKKFLDLLEVQVDEKTYKKASSNIRAIGSDLPRALLAYYYAILIVMYKFSSSVFAPIVIDSPNQQDQDSIKIDKILNFIKNQTPKDTQLILGVADLHGVDIQGKKIELKNEYSLLQEDNYEALNKELSPFLEKAMNDKSSFDNNHLSLF